MISVAQKVSGFYQTEAPGFPVDVNVSDSVQSLPPGAKSVWQHLGSSSPALKKSLQDKVGSSLEEVPIGIEGVLVILNKQNPVHDLSIEQLRAIYTGKISNWKAVGGPDIRIQLYSTETSIGGSLFFQDLVLHGEDIDTTMRGYSNPKDTVAAVASDPAGIGLTPVAEEVNVKYPRISRSNDSPGIEGTSENVRSLTYPLSAYMYWAFAKDSPLPVRQFVEFVLSSRGQMAIEASGCFPLNPNQRMLSKVAMARTQ